MPLIKMEDLHKNLQANLDDVAANRQLLLKERIGDGMIRAITDDYNDSSKLRLQNMLDTDDGKYKIARVRYYQRNCETGCNCDPGPCPHRGKEGRKPKYAKYELTKECFTTPIIFNREQLRHLQEGKMEYMNQEFREELSLFRTHLDNAIIQEVLNHHIGGFAGQGGYTGVPLQIPLYKTDGSINPLGMQMLTNAFGDLSTSGDFILVGGGLLRNYADNKSIACCNGIGQNLANQRVPFRWYYSTKFEKFANNRNLAVGFSPGALGLYTWNKNKGQFPVNVPNLLNESIIFDTITGLPLDFYFRYIECDENWQMWAGLRWGLGSLPLDLYQNCDDLYGTNDVLLFEFVCSDKTICNVDVQTCCKPSAAFTASPVQNACRTYEFDASASASGKPTEGGPECGETIEKYKWDITCFGRLEGFTGEPIKGLINICGTYDKPIFTFPECGDYEIHLMVRDDKGCWSDEFVDTVTVEENCPDPNCVEEKDTDGDGFSDEIEQQADSDPNNPESIPAPIIEVSKSADVGDITKDGDGGYEPNTPIPFVIIIKNTGFADSGPLTVNDDIPACLTNVSTTFPQTIPNVPAGSMIQISYTATPTEECTGDIKNSVVVTGENIKEAATTIVPAKPCEQCVSMIHAPLKLNGNSNVTDNAGGTFANSAGDTYLAANQNHTIKSVTVCGQTCEVDLPVPAQDKRSKVALWAIAAANEIASALTLPLQFASLPYPAENGLARGYMLLAECGCSGFSFTVESEAGGTHTYNFTMEDFKTCSSEELINLTKFECPKLEEKG